MHDIKWIREHPEEFDRGLKRRGPLEMPASALLALDEARRAAITRLETAQARRNAASREIGEAKKGKDEARAQSLLAEVTELKTTIQKLENDTKFAADELKQKLERIANLPLAEVPDGAGPEDNVEHHRFGAMKDYAFAPQQHFDLGEELGQMDFETAAKLSGSRFVVLKNGVARLSRALGQFMIDLHTNEHGYTEIAPPLLVRDEVMFGTAQLPKFKDDQFVATNTEMYQEAFNQALAEFDRDPETAGKINLRMGELLKRLWLIPTAEVPLTNLVREQILDEDALPLRFTALTPCFRAEAGAAGKDTRGMLRQHQFDKVELVSITTPETSRDEHERMLACAEEVLRRLDLHYRVVTLCTGDMGFASQKTYDIEVWLPGQGAYREISSCSVCGEFQARRMDARYRAKADRAVRHVHTLNGSGVAVGRALIAVMETYQDQGGGIAVPDALQSYMGGTKRIERDARA
ncbi:MAG TPA: serine--tRNA ligase [Xanthobacteraceae bacterium]|nr:serine--tRNA ligase [Xanthobacteraceae bacterium]